MTLNFDRALITALRADLNVAAKAGYTTTHLSISMADPKQTVLKPSLLAEADHKPLRDADSSRLKDTDVTLYALGATRAQARDLGDAVYALFFDADGKEIRFDISDQSVYCIGSFWTGISNPVLDSDLDCFRVTIGVTFRWSEK